MRSQPLDFLRERNKRRSGAETPTAKRQRHIATGITVRPVMRVNSMLTCHEWIPDNEHPLALTSEKEHVFVRITERLAMVASNLARSLEGKRTS